MRAVAYATPQDLRAQTRAWLGEVRAQVAPRPHLELDPDRCALLVVDMVRYFAHPTGRAWLPTAEAILPRILLLLGAWRLRGAPVAFTRHGHTGPQDLGMLGRFYSDWIRAEGHESQLVPSLSPRPEELVFRKTTYDSFLDTPLQAWLEDRGVRQVLITGVLTHMCCETTARSAFCRGFEVYVAADGTASTAEARHVASLISMADCVAVVHSTEEILRRCSTC